MSGRNRITIAQSQRLSLNTRLLSSIKVLGSDAAGLSRFLEEAAAENPHLLVEPAPPGDWLPRWSEPLRQLREGAAPAAEEIAAAAGPSLQAHVAELLAGLRLRGAEARLAEGLALALEPSGWLGRPLEALAAEAGLAPAQAEAVLARVQAAADPAGLFARDLAECLRLQAAEEGWLDPLAEGVLARLPLVAAGAVERIARELAAEEAAVEAVIRRIRGLDPKPGARFAACAAPLREPDLIALRGPEGWEVRLNGAALPALRLAGEKGPGRSAAQALVRMVEGRNATLLRVARAILARQVAALEQGIGALRPMTMAEVAEATGLNQSTVSRAVAGTAVDTPRGTWWLRQLFSRPVRGEGPAAAALRDSLARLVAAEDAARPLSDAALAQALAAAGAPVARRTVAKYRDMLGIPPAHRRQKRDRKGRTRG
ncbi:RNA polymerase sigma-54 factor [Rhodobacter sp. SGA-6-6]|uniref:RNA polymerase factor sigma-54 n=1 Tax=Rhodobacter sp. SGA-6-6 TaxID=2710882 RepID=UPI0013EB6DA9|nr:RNA polymerase sigma-54 factor [Rhodobacter sp. SGA-6-6]NGM44698.1 RNA polymerase sigma-54 factor [Rhodobacter sp. SGA-6-6]